MDKDKLLTIAKNAACQAGSALSIDDASLRHVNLEIGRDVKIEADIQSEAIIIEFLSRETEFSILSEERGLVSGKDEEYLWVVDPVDGSLNYSRGIPLCCVSIGLWKGDEPILGVIYDFNRNEMFSGIVGEGAWLNDELITVSKISEKAKAVLCTGFPVKTNFDPENISIFVDQIRNYKKIRLIGSAALSIAYVATGGVEGYYEKDIMFWDVAGGIPIVLGAGGKMRIEKNPKAYCMNVWVTNRCVMNDEELTFSRMSPTQEAK